jgi:hypothetical protein
MKNYKHELIGALHIVKNVMKNYDLELSHNILINGSDPNLSEEDMIKEIEDYLEILDNLIEETWKLEK